MNYNHIYIYSPNSETYPHQIICTYKWVPPQDNRYPKQTYTGHAWIRYGGLQTSGSKLCLWIYKLFFFNLYLNEIHIYLFICLFVHLYANSTRTKRGGSCLRDILWNLFFYRTCMHRAPARPMRALLKISLAECISAEKLIFTPFHADLAFQVDLGQTCNLPDHLVDLPL